MFVSQAIIGYFMEGNSVNSNIFQSRWETHGNPLFGSIFSPTPNFKQFIDRWRRRTTGTTRDDRDSHTSVQLAASCAPATMVDSAEMPGT
jgi:hypothetical protein